MRREDVLMNPAAALRTDRRKSATMLAGDDKRVADDRRKRNRNRIRYHVWVDPGGGLPVVDCEALDISGDGARIRLPKGTTLPKTFTVQYGADGAPRPANLIWRKGDDVGIKFEAEETRRSEHLTP